MNNHWLSIRYKPPFKRSVGHRCPWKGISTLNELMERYGFNLNHIEEMKVETREKNGLTQVTEYDQEKIRGLFK